MCSYSRLQLKLLLKKYEIFKKYSANFYGWYGRVSKEIKYQTNKLDQSINRSEDCIVL